ncbi:MAG: hypothetical protein KA536_15930 [Saprospiraceae bacterium]|nr:hypothetical protein [Saprospiraceae bacterium]
MLQGIQLTLMMGPGIAVPVPSFVIDALDSVSITSGKDQSGFQLSFAVGKNSPILTSLLPAGYFQPVTTRVVVVVTLNGVPNVLMDGFITNQEYAPSSQAGASKLTITGDDLSVAMDLIEIILPNPAMSDAIKVKTRLAYYKALGIMSVVIPPIISIVKKPTEKYEIQRSTDKAFIKKLAQENGYVFYIKPGPLPGMSIAYFGPEIPTFFAQSALSINMDSSTNVEGLTFSLNGLSTSVYVHYIFDPITEKMSIPVPIPSINPMKGMLTNVPVPPFKLQYGDSSASKTADESAKEILTKILNTDNKPVASSGNIDVLRYGKIIQSRTIIGVRGAGLYYDGFYYVDSVTHDIRPGSYKQTFSMSRDGLFPKTPLVPV